MAAEHTDILMYIKLKFMYPTEIYWKSIAQWMVLLM